MYNPENLELPNYDDARLTEYTWSYDIVLDLVLCCEEDFFPEALLEISQVRSPASAFHLMVVPDQEFFGEAEQVFDVEKLNPQSGSFDESCAEILETFGHDKETLVDWYEQSISKDCGFLAMMRIRVTMLWEIRGWPGLTLDFAKSEILGDGTEFEFARNWDVPSADAHVLYEEAVSGRSEDAESLRLSDPEEAASQVLAEYMASPSPAVERELVLSLIEFGRTQIYNEVAGFELAKFHLPELALCVSCGRKHEFSEERICSECRITKGAR